MNRLQISTVTPDRPYAIDVIDPTNSGPEQVTFGMHPAGSDGRELNYRVTVWG